MTAKKIIQTLTSTALLVTLSQHVWGGTNIYVGSKSAGRTSMDHVEHSLLDTLLKKYVNRDGLVNYRAIKRSPADMKALDDYLTLLSSADPKLPAKRESQLAFWINAYNAVTLHGMLREYPTPSIKKHVALAFGYNIWKDLQLYVGGAPVALETMEHEILRPMNDPRIHFAIVCASKGCPRLLNEAYTAERIEDQLELNSRDFFSRAQNFRYEGNRFYLSSILKWYDSDFGSTRAEQLRAYARWMPTESARSAARSGSVSIRFLGYDWSINEQPPRKRRADQPR